MKDALSVSRHLAEPWLVGRSAGWFQEQHLDDRAYYAHVIAEPERLEPLLDWVVARIGHEAVTQCDPLSTRIDCQR